MQTPLPYKQPKRQFPSFPKHPWDKRKTTFFYVFFGVALLLCIFLLSMPDVSIVEKYSPRALQIYDRFGKLITTIEGDEERDYVALKDIPESMQEALMAAEDHAFYSHHGISLKGIARAFLENAEAGKVVQGGSTLTQQLAKNLFFEKGDRSFVRKFREAFVALALEGRYNKRQILEMYLNEVYFGNGAYGIERASLRYFGKSSRQLTLAQSAYLAGLLKSPSSLGNPKNLAEAKERQAYVLDEMATLGFATKAEVEAAKTSTLAFSRSSTPYRKYPYYINAVKELLARELSADRLEEGGLRIYTGMDPVAQNLAEKALSRGVRSAPRGMNQAALVSMNVEDGSIIALVGGTGDYWHHQWNSAIHPHTMGSSFKPFVYLTGFMRGNFGPEDAIDDTPLLIQQAGAPDWEPKNYDGSFMGPITIRQAIAFSRNIAAVRAAQAVGIGNVIETAKAAGFTSQLDPALPLALGSSSASPLEMATAYATIARGGTTMPPVLVTKIEGPHGFLKEFKSEGSRVLPESPVRALISCLESVVSSGTGAAARLPGRPVAGKTGTSDGARDLWFVGFTPDTVTALWGGNDKHLPLGNLSGGGMMAGIWRNYNQAFYKARPKPPGSFYTGSPNLWDMITHPERLLNTEETPEAPADSAQPEEPDASAEETEMPDAAPPQNGEPPQGGMIIDPDTGKRPDWQTQQTPPQGSITEYGNEGQQMPQPAPEPNRNGTTFYGQGQRQPIGVPRDSMPRENAPGEATQHPDQAPQRGWSRPETTPAPAPEPQPAPAMPAPAPDHY